jgi:ElaB/YqjD/DUF883 family membrane-anchored ribosome-binding protein
MGSKEAYTEYLKTDTWKIIRAQRLAMDNCECVLCGNNAENVHHRRYPRKWGTETVVDLISLCGECHYVFHEKDKNLYWYKFNKDVKELSKKSIPEIINKCLNLVKVIGRLDSLNRRISPIDYDETIDFDVLETRERLVDELYKINGFKQNKNPSAKEEAHEKILRTDQIVTTVISEKASDFLKYLELTDKTEDYIKDNPYCIIAHLKE